MIKFVGYFRVSTQKQGVSGLGLEAQQAAVTAWAASNGAQMVAHYVEVESGRKSSRDRPKLAAALAHARAARAVLVVAKLDRLARNVAFLSALMEAGVQFVCVDNPSATPLTIHILAAVAEDEAKRISERTRVALAAYKARGGLLGGSLPQCRPLTEAAATVGRQKSLRVRQQQRTEAYTHLRPLIADLRRNGLSLRQTAEKLNADGYVTRRGKPWNAVQVLRVEEDAQSDAVAV